jgi:hypothetical protein
VTRSRRKQNGNRKKRLNNHQRRIPNTPRDPASQELIFSHSQDHIADQLAQANEQNNKAYTIMAVATALISASVVLQAVIPSHCNTLLSQVFQTAPIAILGLTFLETMLFATISWGTRDFWGKADPLALYEYYHDKSEQDTKDALIKYSLNAYDANKKQLKIKAFWAKVATWALRRFILVFVLFLISQAVLHITC